ncbi:ATP-binding protein [Fusobacterium ulcerans]|uniref:Sensory histidine kinase AtoS n=1 Tax=Fusobacterium ulcerans TaxID=861 RepID=A0AAX2JDV2_9FUSO|nr:ATP-binding protein [Fusobacterium ulcerans]AVQ29489.1 ATP-binding protein [Fusobacterium ulcerans]EFS27010.1 hypothetical protein FUAG_02525 [Fusobacterium ulcerans ATCC 49185]SQJ03972.1 sensory histidine kinase AtoS [Fusobacterium ulcerans]
MGKLKYIVEDSRVAELLGVQNFTKKESAILELVKNSFDAGASELKIIFKEDQLILEDNGKGMNEDDIRNKWMHVGKSSKENEYSFYDIEGNERIYSGSKGIGRFALARLGKRVKLISNKLKDYKVIWETDWNNINFNTEDIITKDSKTKIIISELRDRWNEGSIENLKKYLSRTTRNSKMKIYIEFREKVYKIEEFFSEPKLGINCLSIIRFEYSALDKKLEYTITSDEFTDEAKNYYKGNIHFKNEVLDIYTLFSKKNEKDIELQNKLQELGNFKGEFYFRISASKTDKEKFLYKYLRIPEQYIEGIILYRNSFSISSYDGTKDWIGIGQRARKSPAAATHLTGAWKVRENNIAGKVEIDKNENSVLRDLSNRQGLEENEYYETFIKIIEKVLEAFEVYRQEIIREINKKNVLKETSEEEILQRIIKDFTMIERLDQFEKEKLKTEILGLQKREQSIKEVLKEVENNFKYDARILNMLSTIGLKASSVAHDLQNERNNINRLCKDLKKALIKHKVWDILDKEENKEKAIYNVPQMLEDNEKINKKVSVFIGTLLEDIKKNKFKSNDLKILEVMEKIKNIWERDYKMLKIDLIIDPDTRFKSSEDIFKVIFDNLILNSFQQNSSKDKINIKINIEKIGEFLEISYEDDGRGLLEKYIKDPMKILNVHETSRENGHGLGMWITNNTIIKTSGEIEEIKNILDKGVNRGFYMSFRLGSDI